MQNIIQIKDLIKDFGHNETTTHVIRGIDLAVAPGEFTIVFGTSGSGKSTLLNIINGLEIPSSGEVIVDGQSITKLNDQERSVFHQQKIGMVFQAYNLIPSLSVIENITLPQTFSKIDKKNRLERARTLLTDFKLSDIANRYPSEISGGQAQRVSIMRALINKPPIIVADEPTGNLDSVASKNVMDLFADLNERFNNTMIVVTHDQSLFRYADRIIHILDGKVIKDIAKSKTTSASGTSVKHEQLDLNSFAKDAVEKRIIFMLTVVFSELQLKSFDDSEIEGIIKHTKSLLADKLTLDQYYKLLDKPAAKGGVGLYEPTARHLCESMANIIKLIK